MERVESADDLDSPQSPTCQNSPSGMQNETAVRKSKPVMVARPVRHSESGLSVSPFGPEPFSASMASSFGSPVSVLSDPLSDSTDLTCRTATSSAGTWPVESGVGFAIDICFPTSYPNRARPDFVFKKMGSWVHPTWQILHEFNRELVEKAEEFVGRDESCLEACLCHLEQYILSFDWKEESLAGRGLGKASAVDVTISELNSEELQECIAEEEARQGWAALETEREAPRCAGAPGCECFCARVCMCV